MIGGSFTKPLEKTSEGPGDWASPGRGVELWSLCEHRGAGEQDQDVTVIAWKGSPHVG